MGPVSEDLITRTPAVGRAALGCGLLAALLLVGVVSCGSVARNISGDGGQGGSQGGGEGGASNTDAATGTGGAGGANTGAGGGAPSSMRVRGSIATFGADPTPAASGPRISNQRISVIGLPTCVGAVCVSGGIRP